MKAPLSWLREYVDIDCTAEELKDKLFSCGFEVEDMIYVGKNIDKIVSCKILSIDKHPNADKLSVTKVDAGKYGVLQIITNAKNITVGNVVPVAVDGATLNNGERIYKGELRGVPSDGMFCSGEEFGINDDWYPGASVNGILILDDKFPLGEEVKDLLEIGDVIFDINVTANRPDCQSILGIAREVAAVLGKTLKMPDLTYKTDKSLSTLKTVEIEDKNFTLCPRYTAHFVKDIKIEQSPLWLKRRLFSMGLRSINNIVDITNYVLLEIGQPMHAFDFDELESKKIIVRTANDNESIITLDNKEFKLNSNHLVICDGNKPVALAGVMGGLNSEIKDTTKNVLFESAKFARDNIRKTSRELGQRSDSSARYEKGVDLFSVETGMNRALNLIDKLNCGTIACDGYDLHQDKIEEKVIKTTLSKVNAVLGIDVPKDTVVDILQRLSFKVKVEGDNLEVVCPLYRDDMESYPDIAEEIIREYGYSHIVPTLLKTSAITNGGLNDEQKLIAELKNVLIGFGFNEMISYSFVSEKEYDAFGFDKDSDKYKFIKIMNPLGEDLAVMRTSLLPSVIRAVCGNITRKNFDGRLFEIAKTYHAKQLPLNELPTEKQVLSFAVFGENEDFFTAKGVVEGVVNFFCNGANIEYVKCDRSCMHPTRSAEIIVDGKNVGFFGQMNPELMDSFDVDKPVYGAEIDYELLRSLYNLKLLVNPVSKFPIIERDLAITVDKSILCGDIVKCIEKAGGDYLQKVKLFDIYEGEQIGQGKKSMAFNMIFVANDRTLNIEEVDGFIKNILKALSDNLKAELR